MQTTDTDEIWNGRKGVSYDWRRVLAEVETRQLDAEWAALPELTTADR